jgi:hypothetical protein
VEFLAFGLPGFLLALAGFQIIWSGYLANIALDAASEGATIAATADGTLADGEARATQALKALAGVASATVTSSAGVSGARDTSLISVSLTSPVLAFGLIPISETAEAVDETKF